MIPVEGSAYAYAYGTIGELFAWIIGWGLILEYAMGSMTVAVSWSGYFNKLLHLFNLELPLYLTQDPASYTGDGFSMNLPATLIVLLVTALLVKGTKEAAKASLEDFSKKWIGILITHYIKKIKILMDKNTKISQANILIYLKLLNNLDLILISHLIQQL
jgi:amino acid transporter